MKKIWFFEKTDKIDKLLSTSTKNAKINSIRKETGAVTVDPAEIRRIISYTMNNSTNIKPLR